MHHVFCSYCISFASCYCGSVSDHLALLLLINLILFDLMCAVTASSDAVSDPAGARKLGRASIGVSIFGAVIGIIAIIIIAVVLSVSHTHTP